MCRTPYASVYVTVIGTVQGVGYREWCSREAHRLGLHGWIRNRLDGSVEAIYHGRAERVEEMVRLSAKGPRWAKVEQILSTPCDPPDVAGFIRRPSY